MMEERKFDRQIETQTSIHVDPTINVNREEELNTGREGEEYYFQLFSLLPVDRYHCKQ